METIGQQFKAARERKRISLQVAAQKTKAKIQYLEAIERDDFGKMPAPVYARGFIRTYADFLGIDSVPLVKEYNERHGGQGRPPAPPPSARLVKPVYDEPPVQPAPQTPAPAAVAPPPPPARPALPAPPAVPVPVRPVVVAPPPPLPPPVVQQVDPVAPTPSAPANDEPPSPRFDESFRRSMIRAAWIIGILLTVVLAIKYWPRGGATPEEGASSTIPAQAILKEPPEPLLDVSTNAP